MALNIGKEITALKRMTVPELRRRYSETFGESTTSRHKDFLVRRIAWRLQANEEGGLSERVRQRAEELAAVGIHRVGTLVFQKHSPPTLGRDGGTVPYSPPFCPG